MFSLKTDRDIFSNFEIRANIVTNLGKLPNLNESYLSFLVRFKGMEITLDVIIYGYEDSLKENRYLENNYSECSKVFWMIGYSGQGDGWFINKLDGSIFFYDHDSGDYQIDNFMSLRINFLEFLQLSLLYRELERYLDLNNGIIDKISQKQFEDTVNSIHDNLFSSYPYRYFDTKPTSNS